MQKFCNESEFSKVRRRRVWWSFASLAKKISWNESLIESCSICGARGDLSGFFCGSRDEREESASLDALQNTVHVGRYVSRPFSRTSPRCDVTYHYYYIVMKTLSSKICVLNKRNKKSIEFGLRHDISVTVISDFANCFTEVKQTGSLSEISDLGTKLPTIP